jgi:hypothetical protein
MVKKAKRLFIFEYENFKHVIKGRMRREDFTKEGDKILAFKKEDKNFNGDSEVNRCLKVWGNLEVGTLEVLDCKGLPINSYPAFVMGKVMVLCDKDTKVYFVGCAGLYDLAKDKLKNTSFSVENPSTFSQIKSVEKTQEQIEQEAMDLGDFVAEANKADIPKSKKNINDDKKKEESQKKNPSDGRKHTDERDKRNSSDERDKEKNEREELRRRREEQRRISRERGKRESPKQEEQTAENKDQEIRLLEKQIFNDAKIEEQKERIYTELDDNKAKTLISTFERLKSHLNLLIENKDELNDDDYSQIIIQFVKSPDVEDFEECRQVRNLRAKIVLNSEKFTMFKKEADYYIKMCDLFFKEDKW